MLMIDGSRKLFTQREVADLFRVGPRTVRRWADNGKLTVHYTPGGHRRYERDEIVALYQARRPAGEHGGGGE